MRTGNLSSLSERDWAAIKERRAFEQAEADRTRLTEDQTEYNRYVQIVEESQRRVAPAYRVEPIPFDTWRTHTDQSITDPVVRGAAATNKVLLMKVRSDEAVEVETERTKAREAVLAGKPDPNWKIPASAAGLRLSIVDAKKFAKAEADAFLEATPSYRACKENWDRMRSYIESQGVNIPDRNVFAQAFSRLTELGLMEQAAPEPTPEAQPVPEQVHEPSDAVPVESELLDGFDVVTGEPRKYTQREVWNMDSTTYRKAFRAWGENRPKFTRGYYG